MKVVVCVVGFLYTIVISESSDPGVTSVSKKDIDPSVLGSSAVNCM